MIKEAIGVAPTIEEARKMAIDNLHAPIDADVKVEIVTFPKKKILGLFGGSMAKVKAFVELPDPKPEKKKTEKKPVRSKRK